MAREAALIDRSPAKPSRDIMILHYNLDCMHALLYFLLLSSQSSSEFSTLYENRLIGTEYTTTQASTVAFDALWTIALVLNYTEEMRLQNQTKGHPAHENCSSNLPGDLVPLNEFEYSNAFMGCVMKYNFYKVNFTGVSVSRHVEMDYLYKHILSMAIIYTYSFMLSILPLHSGPC